MRVDKPRMERRRGFTLVELLIVVVILGILAAVVAPRIAGSTAGTQSAALKTSLSRIRQALDLYKVEHNGRFPGYPWNGGGPPNASHLDKQLFLGSDKRGKTGDPTDPQYPHGPYLKEPKPANPVNGQTSINVVRDADPFPTPDDSSGWIYKPLTGDFRANSSGADQNGVPFIQY